MKKHKKYTKCKIFNILPILLLVLACVTASCSEHEDNYYGNTDVGNILLADSRIVSRQGFDASTMTPVGVVIASRSDSVWVVSTRDLGPHCFLDTLMSVQNVSSDLKRLCGRENTAALLQSERYSDAATSVEEYNSTSSLKGWALPSIGELRMLSENLYTVSQTMSDIGGDPFLREQYLSSTQDGSSTQSEDLYAYCITLQTGYVSSILKTERAQVRPVLRLKAR